MLASITLLYAIDISKSEKETKKDLRQNKRDKFEFTLRYFAVRIYECQNFEFDRKYVDVDSMIDSMLLMQIILLKDLRLALNEYEPKDLDTYQALQGFDNDLQLYKQMEKSDIFLKMKLERIIKDLEKIAEKYDFDPLQV